ncbi:MAG: SBBP repeat-containing protein [Candidatus Aenigmatarchaeota archaeon]
MKREKMKNFLIKIIRFTFVFTIIFYFLIGDIVFPKELTEKKIKIKEVYGKLPIYFIENYGQIDEKVKFYAKSSNHNIYFTNEGLHLVLIRKDDQKIKINRLKNINLENNLTNKVLVETLTIKPLNISSTTKIIGEEKLLSTVNYFVGNDLKTWKKDIPTYRKIRYKEIYDGIDLVFYVNQNQIEYDIVVKPEKDYREVAFRIEGAKEVKKTNDGSLEIILPSGSRVIQKKPYVYQEIEGKRKKINGEFELKKDEFGYLYTFNIKNYNKEYALIIDPLVLSYSTYLGGRTVDYGQDITVDKQGNFYVIGVTHSSDFPIKNAYQQTNAGDSDVFVAKFSKNGNLIYSTYLGGDRYDRGSGIAVDDQGNVYISGHTLSTNFPTTQNAYQKSNAGGYDVFVAKLSSNGNLIYSTYIGGSFYDYSSGIAIDKEGNVYVTGNTKSNDFPTKNAYQEKYSILQSDVFVTKLSSDGSSLVYSTYLGGSSDDYSSGIAVDEEGNAYVTGDTLSSDFPTTQNAYQKNKVNSWEVFVTKLSPSGDELIYSTYLGGDGYDYSSGIAVDEEGNAYVTGDTDKSNNFPTKNAYQTNNAGKRDIFIAKLSPDGESLVYSTYFGGSNMEWAYDITIDKEGNAYVTGRTLSNDFPIKDAYQKNLKGVADTFIVKVSPVGELIYSTYFGGNTDDTGSGIAVDEEENIYLIGSAGGIIPWALQFPTTRNAYQKSNAGWNDAFVTKLSMGYILTVTKKGTGRGIITSNPAGINCGSDCSEVYLSGTIVTLKAKPYRGSTFAGWDGDDDCLDGVVKIDANKTCIARFNTTQ